MKYEVIVKRCVVNSALMAYTQTIDLDATYRMLRDSDSVDRIKPFNFNRYAKLIDPEYRHFIAWLNQYKSDTDNPNNIGRRIARNISRVYREYVNYLPTCMRSEEVFATACRAFFCATYAEPMAYFLQVIFFLDMLMRDTIKTKRPKEEILYDLATPSHIVACMRGECYE